MKTETIAYMYQLLKLEAEYRRERYEKAKGKVIELRESGEQNQELIKAVTDFMKRKADEMVAAENALNDFKNTHWQPLT